MGDELDGGRLFPFFLGLGRIIFDRVEEMPEMVSHVAAGHRPMQKAVIEES